METLSNQFIFITTESETIAPILSTKVFLHLEIPLKSVNFAVGLDGTAKLKPIKIVDSQQMLRVDNFNIFLRENTHQKNFMK